ncbi:MAG: SH3 domain-containing protein [Candidatus Paceibacterota bacterium]
MAEEKDVKVVINQRVGKTFGELIMLILLLMLVGQIIGGISGGLARLVPGSSDADKEPGFFSGFGVTFPPNDDDIIFPPRGIEFSFPPSDPVVISFPPEIVEGSNVVNLSPTQLYDEAGGEVIGTVPAGMEGEVIDGPKWVDGEKWWKVQYENGQTGWVAEGDLRSADTEGAIGEEVATYNQTNLLDAPGGSVSAVIPEGMEGEIVGGPVDKDGVRYWEVEFENGERGWVAEDDLHSIKEQDVHGEEVSAVGDTAVYDRPGGSIIDFVSEGEVGVIIGGPQDKDGVRYYEVLFDDGTTGWVKESDLVSTKSNPVLEQEVATYESTPLYDRPGGTQIGTVPPDTAGVIVDGPVQFEGERYWKVEFENGQTGWVAESRLMPSGDTPGMGARVELNRDSPVYATPGGEIIAEKSAGDKATVIGGPVDRDGVRYWLVRFDDGTVGWIPEDALSPTGGTRIWILFNLFIKILSYILVVLLMSGIMYILIRQNQLARDQYVKYWDDNAPYGPDAEKAPLNPEWSKIEELMNSDNENDWRIAIMNADIILDDMLTKMGYHGQTVGEKLKRVESSDFTTLNQAWEAHTVRNMLAHERGLVLTRREAERVISLFKEVFTEFKLI